MRWAALIAAVVLIELAIGFAITIMGVEENCDNGVARWSCNDSLQSVLLVAFFVFPFIVLAVAFIVSGTNKRRGR